jgi:hypothetical protein
LRGLPEIPYLHLDHVDVEIGDLFRIGGYAERHAQAPEFPIDSGCRLGIVVELRKPPDGC